jgi:hypothetical protein
LSQTRTSRSNLDFLKLLIVVIEGEPREAELIADTPLVNLRPNHFSSLSTDMQKARF